MIPYGRQDITEADISAVVAALRSPHLTQGPLIPKFEQAMLRHAGAREAVAVNSATSALHIACLALGLGPGDVLWTVPNTFVASANCARYCGADVDFVDIDPRTWNMCVAHLEHKLAAAAGAGRLPKVVVPVHFGGQPTEQEAIWALARRYGFRVLEDASHSVGGARHGEPVGSCRWSDITVFSFHPVKIITSGEGGMALTNDPALAERMRSLRAHGITRDEGQWRGQVQLAQGALPGPWYYEQLELGYNYRMTDVLAALGESQLQRLRANVEQRNVLAGRYATSLSELPLQLPVVANGNLSACHLYVVRIDPHRTSATRERVFDFMRSAGIGVNLHYLPVHLQPYYQALGFAIGDFPEAEAHGREAITLPMFPGLSEQMQDEIVARLEDAL